MCHVQHWDSKGSAVSVATGQGMARLAEALDVQPPSPQHAQQAQHADMSHASSSTIARCSLVMCIKYSIETLVQVSQA